MPEHSRDAGRLLAQLDSLKNRFDPGHAARVAALLTRLARIQFQNPSDLIRFHEILLFLRAFPHAPPQVSTVERLLNTFHSRVQPLRDADMSLFDDFDTSGIAGTVMQDTLSYDVAQWLARRIPRNVDIAWQDYWDDFAAERSRGATWPRFIPLLAEDADVEANIPWSRWLDAARGRHQALPWILERFSPLSLPPRQRSELYDSLRIPIRWRLENLKLTRTRNWSRPRRFYFHDAPLIERRDVSLKAELSKPAPSLLKLSRVQGEAVMHAIREIMLVRYRELYGTTLGDPRTVVRADLGRGVVMHFWGLPPERRLPLRAYLAGYTLKNGVPINYIEAIGLCEWIEVGFNTFYTYRQGETAWIYAQALRCLHALTGATTISIYPYQIGDNNDEAIDSGAFWFYRKLGFHSGRPDLRALCEREERRIAANPGYRTPPRTLKRLARAHMFYDLPGKPSANAWSNFSVRNIGLSINRRMAKEFAGDSERMRSQAVRNLARILRVNLSSLTRTEIQSFENWSLVLARIPGLPRWSASEKQQLVRILRSKSARNEVSYLRLTQKLPRLRSEILRLGSPHA